MCIKGASHRRGCGHLAVRRPPVHQHGQHGAGLKDSESSAHNDQKLQHIIHLPANAASRRKINGISHNNAHHHQVQPHSEGSAETGKAFGHKQLPPTCELLPIIQGHHRHKQRRHDKQKNNLKYPLYKLDQTDCQDNQKENRHPVTHNIVNPANIKFLLNRLDIRVGFASAGVWASHRVLKADILYLSPAVVGDIVLLLLAGIHGCHQKNGIPKRTVGPLSQSRVHPHQDNPRKLQHKQHKQRNGQKIDSRPEKGF